METFSYSPNEEELPVQEKDISPEVVETVMEEFREKRAGMLGKIMGDRAAKITEKVGLMAPGLDIVALATSAAKGETLTGKELDGRSRFNYAAAAGFLTLSYVLLATGQHKEALAAKGAAAAFGTIEFGPETYESIVKLAKNHTPSVASFLEKTGNFVKKTPAVLEEARRSMASALASDPDLIALNLHG